LVVPPLHELRLLELKSPVVDSIRPSYNIPDFFISLLAQIPTAMPNLERVFIQVTTSRSWEQWRDVGLNLNEVLRIKSRLKLGYWPVFHCQLRFVEYGLPFEPVSEATRKLRRRARACIKGSCSV
jgi:hypothetical protein